MLLSGEFDFKYRLGKLRFFEENMPLVNIDDARETQLGPLGKNIRKRCDRKRASGDGNLEGGITIFLRRFYTKRSP